jgi:hypothetical protein
MTKNHFLMDEMKEGEEKTEIDAEELGWFRSKTQCASSQT